VQRTRGKKYNLIKKYTLQILKRPDPEKKGEGINVVIINLKKNDCPGKK